MDYTILWAKGKRKYTREIKKVDCIQLIVEHENKWFWIKANRKGAIQVLPYDSLPLSFINREGYTKEAIFKLGDKLKGGCNGRNLTR